MISKIRKDIIPLLISIILVLITLFSKYNIDYRFYMGALLIGISALSYFKYKKLYIYIFTLTLVLGITNLITILFADVTVSFGPIHINPICVVLLISFLVLNKNLLNKFFPEKVLTEKQLALKKSNTMNLIKNYEQKFKFKTESELKKITEEKSRYIQEAKIASKNILNKTNFK